MITEEAIRRTVRQLRQSKHAPQYVNICKALNLVLAHQCDMDKAEEQRLEKAEKVLDQERY